MQKKAQGTTTLPGKVAALPASGGADGGAGDIPHGPELSLQPGLAPHPRVGMHNTAHGKGRTGCHKMASVL